MGILSVFLINLPRIFNSITEGFKLEELSSLLQFVKKFFLVATLSVVFAEVLNGRSVSDYIYIVRANKAILGSIISILTYLGRDIVFPSLHWTNLLTTIQLGWSTFFTILYLLESMLKWNLYLDKVYSLYEESNKELYIYIGSAILDVGQTIFTISGLS